MSANTCLLESAPDRNRTCNLPLRRRLLYPIELRGLKTAILHRAPRLRDHALSRTGRAAENRP